MNYLALLLALGASGLVVHAAEVENKPKPPAAPPIPEWARAFDKNGDGKLDPDERAAAVAARRQEMMKAMLKKFDKNGDGQLDAEEQKAMNEQRKKEREEAMAKRQAQQQPKKEEKKDEKK